VRAVARECQAASSPREEELLAWWRRSGRHRLRVAQGGGRAPGARGDRLQPADTVLIERLLRESQTWALVDELAALVAGSLSSAILSWASCSIAGRATRTSGSGDPRSSPCWSHSAGRPATFAILAVRGDDAGGEGVLHPQGDRLGVARHRAQAPDLVYAWLLPRRGRVSGVTSPRRSSRLFRHSARRCSRPATPTPDGVATSRGLT